MNPLIEKEEAIISVFLTFFARQAALDLTQEGTEPFVHFFEDVKDGTCCFAFQRLDVDSQLPFYTKRFHFRGYLVSEH